MNQVGQGGEEQRVVRHPLHRSLEVGASHAVFVTRRRPALDRHREELPRLAVQLGNVGREAGDLFDWTGWAAPPASRPSGDGIPAGRAVDAAQLLEKRAGVRRSVARLLGHEAGHQGVEEDRRVRPAIAHRWHGPHHVGREDRERGVTRVGRHPGQQLVRHAAEPVEIGPTIKLSAPFGLLGARVGGAADDEPRLRHASGLGTRRPERHAEVREQGAAAVPEDVLRLHVPVDRAHGVRVRQRLGDVGHDADDFGDRERALPLEARAERLPLDVRHDVVEERRATRVVGRSRSRGRHPRVEQGHDVRVHEARRQPDLAREPFGAERGGDIRVEHLDGHVAIERGIVRQVDGAHSAATQLPGDAEAARERGKKGLIGWRCGGHHCSLTSGRWRRQARGPAPRRTRQI